MEGRPICSSAELPKLWRHRAGIEPALENGTSPARSRSSCRGRGVRSKRIRTARALDGTRSPRDNRAAPARDSCKTSRLTRTRTRTPRGWELAMLPLHHKPLISLKPPAGVEPAPRPYKGRVLAVDTTEAWSRRPKPRALSVRIRPSAGREAPCSGLARTESRANRSTSSFLLRPLCSAPPEAGRARVETEGVEPSSAACKAGALPVELHPRVKR